MHTHEDAWNAALQVAGGVTTSRDMGNDNANIAEMRANIAAGRTVGPHIEPAGFIEGESPFSARGGFVVASVAEAEHAVDWYAQRGYRQVKLYNSIKPEWAAPIAAYAHKRGLRVSGHVPAFSRSERVVREGYDELQHINQLMLNFVSDPDTDSRTIVRFNLVGGKVQGPRPRFAGSARLHRAARRPPGRGRRDPGDLRGLLDAEARRSEPRHGCGRGSPAGRNPAGIPHQRDRRERRPARDLPRVLEAHAGVRRTPACGGRAAGCGHR